MKFFNIFGTLLFIPCIIVQSDVGSPSFRKPRIIKGNHAHHYQFPYHVSIVVNGIYRCGGSLFDKQHVLTAAHCLYDKGLIFDAYDLTINIYHISIFEEDPARVGRRVDKVFVPSEFLTLDSWYVNGDIAVLKLNETVDYPLKWNVTLGEKKSYAGKNGMVTGHGLNWKLTRASGMRDGLLRFTGVTIISNEDCSAAWGYKLVPESLVCAQTGRYASGSLCDGDSGGPLMYNGKYIVGVLSLGASKCAIGGTEIFTRVSYYHDFIKKAAADAEYHPDVLTYDTTQVDYS